MADFVDDRAGEEPEEKAVAEGSEDGDGLPSDEPEASDSDSGDSSAEGSEEEVRPASPAPASGRWQPLYSTQAAVHTAGDTGECVRDGRLAPRSLERDHHLPPMGRWAAPPSVERSIAGLSTASRFSVICRMSLRMTAS